MNKPIVEPFVITHLPSLRGAKRRGNLHGIHAAIRLPLGRETCRRAQVESLENERLRGVYPERSRRARNDNSETRPTAGRQEGWTLIEVLVAVVILCVGLLAVGTMQISAIRGNFMGGNTSIALTLAGQKMEDLLNMDFNDARLADSNTGNNGDLSVTAAANVDHQENLSDAGVVGAGGFYRRIWNVADTATPWPTMKQITVIVTWENNKHRVTISSMRRP